MPGVASDVTTAWTIKQPALRTAVNLDLTTAVALRVPTVLASASSTSSDYTTKLRDYYADVANAS